MRVSDPRVVQLSSHSKILVAVLNGPVFGELLRVVRNYERMLTAT
jgi:hypothetical protein